MDNYYKKKKIWEQVLEEYCRCFEDGVGNRPCDNGCLCDRCHTKDVDDVYSSMLRKAGIER